MSESFDEWWEDIFEIWTCEGSANIKDEQDLRSAAFHAWFYQKDKIDKLQQLVDEVCDADVPIELILGNNLGKQENHFLSQRLLEARSKTK